MEHDYETCGKRSCKYFLLNTFAIQRSDIPQNICPFARPSGQTPFFQLPQRLFQRMSDFRLHRDHRLARPDSYQPRGGMTNRQPNQLLTVFCFVVTVDNRIDTFSDLDTLLEAVSLARWVLSKSFRASEASHIMAAQQNQN